MFTCYLYTTQAVISVPCLQAGGGEKKEHLYKILVIGELGTGKTSIIKRYVHQLFSQVYRATIGIDFALKVLNWDAETIVRLQLWDIAGKIISASFWEKWTYCICEMCRPWLACAVSLG